MLDGPINGRSFLACVRQLLVPTLTPSDVVILNNPGSHKGQAVRRAIRAARAHLLFPPPYSPDLNPIKQVFATLQTLLRKADKRSITCVSQRIPLDAFPPAKCANYLRNSVYQQRDPITL